mmetsp:Transcript_3480/g.9228  ORF Transcript_3480/g.9228 Transcript_3480/m.9228 type:complete len:105 (-) Transcript_3480:1172-1486(-)
MHTARGELASLRQSTRARTHTVHHFLNIFRKHIAARCLATLSETSSHQSPEPSCFRKRTPDSRSCSTRSLVILVFSTLVVEGWLYDSFDFSKIAEKSRLPGNFW